ncbi:hypothetical protein ACQUY5_27100 [Bacillus cereus]|uniref:hypothetical protein n=1 Tax=Bacillus cereus TaxID=1396 RepID=UPI003D167399
MTNKGLIKRVTDKLERSLEEQNTWCHCKTPTQRAKVTETLERTIVDVYCINCYKPIYGQQFLGQIDREEMPKIEKRLVNISELDTSKDVLHVVHTSMDSEVDSTQKPLCFTGNYNPKMHQLATIYDILLDDKHFIKEAKNHYLSLEDGLYVYDFDGETGKWVKLILDGMPNHFLKGLQTNESI